MENQKNMNTLEQHEAAKMKLNLISNAVNTFDHDSEMETYQVVDEIREILGVDVK